MKPFDKDQILYLDNHLLIVSKPKGLLTQPSPICEDSLENQAKEYLRAKFDKKAGIYLHTIHRLDKDVSGIVVFARSKKALSRLNEAMRKHKFTKIYEAKVEGIVTPKQGVLKDYIAHLDHRAKIVPKTHPKAKLAILEYEVVSTKNNVSILQIELKTGRYHQIRAQLSHRGHPILGDRKYGAKEKRLGIELEHKKFLFCHPVTKEELSVFL